MAEIQTLPIQSIKPNPDNPRIIKDDKFKKLVKSIQDFPQMLTLRPIVINDDNVVLGGNMRLKACKEAGLKQVPTLKAADLTEEQQKEFIIKDNVGFGEWDWDTLGNEWDAEQLQEWGLDIPDFTVEKELAAEEDDYTIPDTIETDIVPGDLFEIGPHRLLCGDSTDSDNWERLKIEKTSICFTSPPYNVGASAKLTGNKAAAKKGNFYETHDDNQSEGGYKDLINETLKNAILFCSGAAFNVQPLSSNKTILLEWILDFKDCFVDIITWDKGQAQPAMAEGVLNSRFEWVCIFSGEGNNSRRIPQSSWRGTMNNVYQGPPQRTNEFASLHAATFPVHLPSFIIADLMNRSTSVIDCFMGTGTTMVAAHQLGRKSYGIELDPKYCQVIIDRMLQLDPTLTVKRNGEPYLTGVKQVENGVS